MRLARYWINQPSALQTWHKWHGLNVLADVKAAECVCYFVAGDSISMQISPIALSPGWLEPGAKQATRQH